MPIRYGTVKDEETLADKANPTVDLSKNDWISAILIEYYAQNGSTSNQANDPDSVVTKLEVTDGSYVLKSMTGVENSIGYLYDNGVVPPHVLTENLSEYQRAYFVIPFGRYIGDPMFAINAKDFGSLQLKMSHNLAENTAVGVTGYLAGSAKWTVTVVRFEDMNLSPLGWIKTEQKKDFVTAASGVKECELPTDHEYRRIMVRSFITNDTIGMDKFTLDMGDGKFKPWDGYLFRKLRAENVAHYKTAPEVVKKLFQQDADTVESNIYDTLPGGLRGISSTLHNVGLTENYGLVTIDLSDLAVPGAIAADEVLFMQVKGNGYHNSHMIPCDIGGEFLDARKYGSAVLKLNQTGVTRSCQVVLDEIMRGRGQQ